MEIDHNPFHADREEYLSLYDNVDFTVETQLRPRSVHRKKSWDTIIGRKSCWPAVVCHFCLVVIYTIAFLLVIWNQQSRPPLIYSPARDGLSYVSKTVSVLYNDTTNPFLRDSSEDIGADWYKLLQNMNIRINEEEMRALGKDSIQLSDGSGDHLASLDIYHQLHCLKFLRTYVDNGILPSLRIEPKHHAYHCIEMLRQVIQCHGDIAVVSYDWLPDDKAPMPRWEIEHECVDWEALDSWAASRRISISQKGLIVHPELGESFA